MFAKSIAERFSVNLQIYVCNATEHDLTLPEEKYLDFNHAQQYFLTVNYYDNNWNNPSRECVHVTYELTIPIKSPNENDLTIEFYPNGVILLSFLTFNHAWVFFISDLKGENDHYSESHKVIVDGFNQLRTAYKLILSKIGCSAILIYTDAPYKFEEELFRYTNEGRYTFDQVISTAKEFDKVSVFDFYTVLNTSESEKLSLLFQGLKDVEIVLVDTLQ